MRKLILDGNKLAWHRDRVEAWKKGEKIAPITIDCALTRACNYKCTYCYSKLQTNDIKRMTEKVLLDFLDDAKEIGVKAISLVSDGESTLSPHLTRFISHAHDIGLDIALGTNGFRLTKEQIDIIVPKLSYLRFNVSAGESGAYSRIHGVTKEHMDQVIANISRSVKLKKELKKDNMTIGLQLVLVPGLNEDQIIPTAKLGQVLGVDYTIIKHCSDDEKHTLGIDYEKYFELKRLLEQAESMSTQNHIVGVKWSKILSKGGREYDKCYGPAFIMQFSGSGLVAPCGMLFNNKFKKDFHIGNIAEKRFKEIFESKRYDEVMKRLASPEFNPKTDCGSLCLQHKVNETLFDIKHNGFELEVPKGESPLGVNFV